MNDNEEREVQVLVVAAHPDDEALGCGGALLHHLQRGHRIHLLFLTDGVSARGSDTNASQRRKASKRVSKLLRASSHTQLDFPDNMLDTVPLLELARSIEGVAIKCRPDVIYTHHLGDLNIDHRRCGEAVLTAFRPLPNANFSAIYGFEVQSSTEWSPRHCFRPTHFVNITNYLEEKKKLLSEYAEELREFPHPRSLEAVHALATWRGSAAGFDAAEAFETLNSRWF